MDNSPGPCPTKKRHKVRNHRMDSGHASGKCLISHLSSQFLTTQFQMQVARPSWMPPPSRSEMPPLPLPKRGRGCPHGSSKAKGSVEVKTSTSKKAELASKKTAASLAKLEEV